MSHFSTALDRWMKTIHGLTIKTLGAHSGIPASNLSIIRLGKKEITLPALAKLLPSVEELEDREAARTLLVAYLRDEIPLGWDQDVKITLVESGVITDKSKVSEDWRDSIAKIWRKRAERDIPFANWWKETSGYIMGEDSPKSDDRSSGRNQIVSGGHIRGDITMNNN